MTCPSVPKREPWQGHFHSVAAASQPISDVRGSERYRRAMAAVIARRAIGAALARAAGRHVPIPASLALHGAGEV